MVLSQLRSIPVHYWVIEQNTTVKEIVKITMSIINYQQEA